MFKNDIQLSKHLYSGKCIIIVGVKNDGKGFTSRKRIFFICLDKKGRLVLPLEIREALDIPTNGKIVLSVARRSRVEGRSNEFETLNSKPETKKSESNYVLVKISTASPSDITNSIAFSRNGRYMKEKEGD